MALNATFELTGTSKYTSTGDVSASSNLVTLGSNNFDAISASLADGTDEDESEKHWSDERSVAGGANDDIDLTSLTGPYGSLSFSRVTVVIIDVDTPDGAKKIRVGPQGVTNGWQAWHGGVSADHYAEERQSLFRTNTKGVTPGWTVGGTNKVLRIHNPGGSSVTYRIYIAGV